MAFGILLGAWLYRRDGQAMVWVGFAVALAASVIDTFWGSEIGSWLGSMTRAALTTS